VQDLQHIISKLPIGVWVAAVPSGAAVYVNAAFLDIIGMVVAESSQIEDASRTYGIFDRSGNPYPVPLLPFSRVVSTGQAVVVDDLVIHRADGTQVNVRAFAQPVFGAGDALTHVSVAFLDITREVQAEAERDQAAAHLALAVDHAPIVLWSADKDGIITVSQGAALASLGVKSGQLLGHNLFELYAGHPTISAYIRRGLAGESLQYLVEVGEAAFDTWMVPIRNAEGAVIGITALSHDVRELRKLQAAGIQSDRSAALGTLAASVAHEINNPLTYIFAHAEQMDESLERLGSGLADPGSREFRADLATLREEFQSLRAGVERIASITRELRTFSHPDDKGGVPVDARAAVRSVLQLVGKEVEHRAWLSLELGETAPIIGHPTRLVQVILNLVMNAMQSLPAVRTAESEVHIRTDTLGQRVVIEVSDSGPGVPVAERERIFEPFVTTKPIGDGTGLGLFVCRNIVHSYGGEVSVHDRPGGGALFRVSLPATAHVQAAGVARDQEASGAPHTRAHVLVIDDEAQVVNALSGSLRRAGYRTSSCSSGAAGLQRLMACDDIDLVFCDLMMKEMTGMELYARLREHAPAVIDKIVFMTGGAYSPAARQFLLDHPGQRIVEKPFDVRAETERRLQGRPASA
jgi:signal transduction histidine kinase/CheY-like chemotaxis protein